MRYNNRRERAWFAATRYAPFVGHSILDVGGDRGYMREYVSGTYLCLDIAGAPDVLVDLEDGRLPFGDQTFETVFCLDVLEHLESIHDAFVELARVAARYMIVSLPNAWRYLDKLRSGRPQRLKFYGLPLEPPADRHRWFFSYTDAVAFVRGMADRTGMVVRICEPYLSGRKRADGLHRALRRLLWSEDRFNNLEALALWAVLEREAHDRDWGVEISCS